MAYQQGYGNGSKDTAEDKAQTIADNLKEKAGEVSDAVLQKSAEAYDSAKRTVEEQPLAAGIVALTVVGVLGFVVGALWKSGSRTSRLDGALSALRSHADPYLDAIRNARIR